MTCAAKDHRSEGYELCIYITIQIQSMGLKVIYGFHKCLHFSANEMMDKTIENILKLDLKLATINIDY